MTVDNLSSVMSVVKPANRRHVWKGISVPPARLDATESTFTSINDQTTSYVDYFVNCSPFAIWSTVLNALYEMGTEPDALQKAQKFLPRRDSRKGIFVHTLM